MKHQCPRCGGTLQYKAKLKIDKRRKGAPEPEFKLVCRCGYVLPEFSKGARNG